MTAIFVRLIDMNPFNCYLRFCFCLIVIFFLHFINICSAENNRDHKFLDLLLYGDFSHKTTNFLNREYDSVSGWAEQRIVLQFVYYDSYYEKHDTTYVDKGELFTPKWLNNNISKLVFPNPYLKLTEAASGAAGFTSFTVDGFPFHVKGRMPYENTFVWGFGVENRLMERIDEVVLSRKIKDNKYLDWIRSYRLYAEYLNLEYLTRQWWQSEHELRVGIDFWYEWNVPAGAGRGKDSTVTLANKKKDNKKGPLPIWGELWQDLSYRKTNFFIDDYDSLSFGASGKFGVRLFDYPKNWSFESKWSVHVMPYVKGELALSERDYFWGNRFLAGCGIRIMPRIKIAKNADLLLRFYGEYINVIDYFEDGPNSENPWEDIRFGINFSINRY